MSASERAQALHYRQEVEALFDDYAPDFEASHHVHTPTMSTPCSGPANEAGRHSQLPERCLGCARPAEGWWRPVWPTLAAVSNRQASLLSLGYDIPAEMVRELRGDCGDGAADAVSHTVAVDLGCGTGLAGAALKPFCRGALLGCDLSSKMLRLARKKRIYERLEEVDACMHMCMWRMHVKLST